VTVGVSRRIRLPTAVLGVISIILLFNIMLNLRDYTVYYNDETVRIILWCSTFVILLCLRGTCAILAHAVCQTRRDERVAAVPR
jgi:hypothetical protein